jgi:primosomal protein N' (replication factor Y)
MFAEVIVLRNTQSLDRPFTYRVPSILEPKIKIGSRVLVPFGTSGHLEGIVIDLTNSHNHDASVQIKPIHYLFNDHIFLTELDLKCAAFIREETICSFSEAIQLFLPSNTLVKQIKSYQLNPEWQKNPEIKFKKNELVILDALGDKKVDYDALCPDMKESLKNTALNRLLALGVIDLEYLYEQNVKNRTVEWVVVKGDLPAYIKTIKPNHHAKLKLANYLITLPFIKRMALQEATKVSKNVIDGFVSEGLIEIQVVEDLRLPVFMKSLEDKAQIDLNSEQQRIYNQIVSDYENQRNDDFLIHGITGSGKTEIYAELIQYVLGKGKKAILVVPEISLTPQIVARFASRFGEARIALIHSKISPGEKHDQWKGIRKGDYDIIIGARSAIFAPTDDVGIVIIDECHEGAFRSEKRPKYHTYDVAKFRMKQTGGLVVSGSATPAIKDYHEALSDKRKLHRYNLQELPEIEIVDMRQELMAGNRSILSRKLYEAIADRLMQKQQTIIFLNRKGHSTFVSCRSCGFTLACPNCDVTLTYFKGQKTVKCNYCSYETFVPKKCPKCESKYFKFFGVGTEKVEESLSEMFPSAKIARMDRTTTTKKGSIERIISEVEAEEVDILIGTQMVAKGFDFKGVTLIGILSADLLLNLPHYQASERAYQLFNQVAGRAGRGKEKGEVILQTYAPDHYALNQDSYESFYQNEIQYRKALKYPPFYHLISIMVTSTSAEEAATYALKSHDFIARKMLKKGLQNQVDLYPANPALLKKIDNKYRWQVIIKVKPESLTDVKRELKILESHFESLKACKIAIDFDASNIL